MNFKQIAIAAALALAGMAQAQTSAQAPAAAPAAPAAPTSEAKKALVARVLQLQQPGIEMMARQLAEQPARQLLQRAGQALQAVPADRREALARDIEADARKYAEDATPIVVSRAVQLAPSTIGALLEERLTEQELREVVGILESAAHLKFQSLGGEMQRAIGEKLVAETRGEVGPKVQALEQAVAARLQPQADAASAAKPKPAPKPAAPAKKP